MCKNIVEAGQSTRGMRIACWIPRATHTPAGFAIPVAMEDDFVGEALRIWGRLLIFMQCCAY
jgi:hypothetical protein